MKQPLTITLAYIRKGCTPVLVLPHEHLLLWNPMRTPMNGGVHIGSHFNKNACMHEQTTMGTHGKEVPELMYTLCRCRPLIIVAL